MEIMRSAEYVTKFSFVTLRLLYNLFIDLVASYLHK